MDRNEAKQVLKRYRKDKPLDDLYDSVLIPALSLAEQDRHRNEIDEATETFVCQSIKELVEEINDRSHEQRELDAKDADETASSDASPSPPQERAANRAGYVVCMPVRDEADEIIGTMLAHLLERAGYRTRFLAIGTTVEMLAQVSEEKPDIVCLSALPPFAVGHARSYIKIARAISGSKDCNRAMEFCRRPEASCEPDQRHRRCRSFKDSGARRATSQLPDRRCPQPAVQSSSRTNSGNWASSNTTARSASTIPS
jgi:hypothetical protein